MCVLHDTLRTNLLKGWPRAIVTQQKAKSSYLRAHEPHKNTCAARPLMKEKVFTFTN